MSRLRTGLNAIRAGSEMRATVLNVPPRSLPRAPAAASWTFMAARLSSGVRAISTFSRVKGMAPMRRPPTKTGVSPETMLPMARLVNGCPCTSTIIL